MSITLKKSIFISLVGFIIGLFLVSLYDLGICTSFFCSDTIAEGVGVPMGFFSIAIFIVSTILFFLREEIFRSWFKFARIYIPLALIFIFLSALSPGGGSWGVSNNFDAEAATWFFSGLFLLISLILIAYKSWKLKKTLV